ncbi:fumarylacetoacetate hydrolase family protein [Clostridium sp.]|uniref:fumarylacetoacetate hydrolase family protein n=1 Tax=Clostridium sp. TaxID=1506 RepID=UPI00283B8108|nr:fumarylacetoacetate hydrolase family protein [Clostridium sp.]MDR3596182.1 fumarylacetoacetate hydrolase family protein [Clostridium sp.]
MKFITFKYDNKEQVGILSKNEQNIYPLKTLGVNYNTMNDLIENITNGEMAKLQTKIEKEPSKILSINDISKMAPIPNPKQDIICLGINYMAHAVESARYKKEAFGGDRPYAVYFSKRVTAATGDGDYIPSYPALVDSLDYEVELAVIIGKDAKNVTKEDTFDYVFGYTIMNDVSARNLQTRHKQWYFGKSLDGFTPMGPCIVTKDEFSTPPVLKICSKVNGELRQNSTTDLMITSIEDAIHELSQGMTLKAGTIIAMGTPAGVGMGFEPPRFLTAGDVVECEIEGIGHLKNTVK